MEARVKKWGNSAAVRIPAAVLAEARVSLDDRVEVLAKGGKIVIEPKRGRRRSLEELVRGITADNLHAPIETGGAVGREVW